MAKKSFTVYSESRFSRFTFHASCDTKLQAEIGIIYFVEQYRYRANSKETTQ